MTIEKTEMRGTEPGRASPSRVFGKPSQWTLPSLSGLTGDAHYQLEWILINVRSLSERDRGVTN